MSWIQELFGVEKPRKAGNSILTIIQENSFLCFQKHIQENEISSCIRNKHFLN